MIPNKLTRLIMSHIFIVNLFRDANIYIILNIVKF
jgi:hypothetical protein